MKNQKSISIGLVGVGHLGKFHLRHLINIAKINISGIFDINFDRANLISQEFNVKFVKKLNNLYKTSDAIIIATPTNSHFKIAKESIKSNCHVFIEKPITDNLNDAKKLLKYAKEMNKIIQVGHIERFNPAFKKLEELKIKPIFIESHRLAPFNIRGIEVPVVLDLMIHDIDIILSLINSKIKKISANGVDIISKSIDIANARLEFENGSVANLTSSRISQKEMRKMRIFQKNNYFSIDFKKNIIEIFSLDYKGNNFKIEDNICIEDYLKYETPPIIKKDALKEEILHFIHSIKHNNTPKTDIISAIECLKIALKIQKIIDN